MSTFEGSRVWYGAPPCVKAVVQFCVWHVLTFHLDVIKTFVYICAIYMAVGGRSICEMNLLCLGTWLICEVTE